MAKPTLTAGDEAVSANQFVQVRAEGLDKGKAHLMTPSVKDGPDLPAVSMIADSEGKAAASVFVFMPGTWHFALALNEDAKALAECGVDVQ